MVETTLGLLGLDKYLMKEANGNCIVERHTSEGPKYYFILDVEVGGNSMGGVANKLRAFADDIEKSEVVETIVSKKNSDIEKARSTIERLQKYETHYKAQYLMIHGEDPNAVMGFL